MGGLNRDRSLHSKPNGTAPCGLLVFLDVIKVLLEGPFAEDVLQRFVVGLRNQFRKIYILSALENHVDDHGTTESACGRLADFGDATNLRGATKVSGHTDNGHVNT